MDRLGVSIGISLALLVTVPLATEGKPKKGAKEPKVEQKELVAVWPSPLDPGLLDSVFSELPFGKGTEELLDVLQLRLEEQIKPVLKVAGSPRERDAMKEAVSNSVSDVRKSFEEFKGQKTPYAVSVVADEYKDNVGEGLMRYPYATNHAYFFFSGGKFWKMLLCLEGDPSMAELVQKGLEKYGPAADIYWADEEKKVPLRAQWRDGTFEVAFEPPDDVFSCKRLVWVYVPEKARVMQARGTTAGEGGSGSLADDLLKQITEEPKPPIEPKKEEPRKEPKK